MEEYLDWKEGSEMTTVWQIIHRKPQIQPPKSEYKFIIAVRNRKISMSLHANSRLFEK